MSYYLSHVLRLCITPCRGKFSVRCVTNSANLAKETESHIYKKKYNTNEIIQYLKDNIVYDSEKFLVTCVPQGVHIFPQNEWHDYDKTPVFDIGLQNIIPQLCKAFGSEYIFISKHPRRTSSGLLILAKDFKIFQTIRQNCTLARIRQDRIFCYLAIVLGSPEQTHIHDFKAVKQIIDDKSIVEIFELDDGERGTVFKYKHEVIDSTEHVSLLRVTVSCDTRDIVRHTLSQKMFTPILGDVWSSKKIANTLFGAPLASDSSTLHLTPFKLNADILSKLELKEDEENIIPICSHLYSIRLEFKKKSEFFVSVPPTKSFVWTCKQLGLRKIKQFVNS